MAAQSGEVSVVNAAEAEMFVEQLKAMPVKDIGSPSWLAQHDYLEKLNMQAHINASLDTDEFVVELLVSYNKVPVLVHELMAIEVWREKVYPLLVKRDFANKNTMVPYIILYHEATVVNLLETVLYHKEALESAEDAILDLVDYCSRRMTYLVAVSEDGAPEQQSSDDLLDLTGQQQLERQAANLPFDVAVKAVSIARYITDNITTVPLSCLTRVLNTHDWPSTLASLASSPPWTRTRGGVTEKLKEGTWSPVSPSERLQLTKHEAQVWLGLYNLLMEIECRRKYQFNSFNKAALLKLRGLFNDVLVDQLPPLGELRRFLEEMAVADPPDPESSIILEQVPELRDHLLKVNRNKWGSIADYQLKTVFSDDPALLKQQAQRLAETYNLDALENLLPDDPKCTVCGAPASNRCSRCQNEWYCRRQCQVEHWPKHKASCDLVRESAKGK
eukprot:m.9616 g.9616  ORF g.9616 m.9616 type:complete len:446 (-) comp3562_c0_seq1:26-1363(-)